MACVAGLVGPTTRGATAGPSPWGRVQALRPVAAHRPRDQGEAALAGRVAASAGAVVIHAEHALSVPRRKGLLKARPDRDLARFGQVAECGLVAPPGLLVVAGLLDEVGRSARLRVPVGRLRALVTFEGLGNLGWGRSLRRVPGAGRRATKRRRAAQVASVLDTPLAWTPPGLDAA